MATGTEDISWLDIKPKFKVKPQGLTSREGINIYLIKGVLMKKIWISSLTLGALAFSLNVSAQSLQVKQWASACFACHGTDGYSEGGMASLAGQKKADLIEKMKDYQSGKRVASIMHQLSKGYSDEQIVAIAGYFAALPHENPVAKTK